jgi:hypothetical protein
VRRPASSDLGGGACWVQTPTDRREDDPVANNSRRTQERFGATPVVSAPQRVARSKVDVQPRRDEHRCRVDYNRWLQPGVTDRKVGAHIASHLGPLP